MTLGIFKRTYTLRRFEKTQIVRGRVRAAYTDSMVSLDVQPLTSDDIMTLPEGMRRKKNVRVFGRLPMYTADEKTGTLADRIYYRGEWYECVGVSTWGNTPVGQTEAVYGLIPAESGVIQLAPVIQEEGEGMNGGEG
ncbi:MAG: hypothetical protein K1W20_04860 [Lachnospiraceae bacterium]